MVFMRPALLAGSIPIALSMAQHANARERPAPLSRPAAGTFVVKQHSQNFVIQARSLMPVQASPVRLGATISMDSALTDRRVQIKVETQP